jgi:hypothetical protein
LTRRGVTYERLAISVTLITEIKAEKDLNNAAAQQVMQEIAPNRPGGK